MKGFRRAQLKGSEELFRSTDVSAVPEQEVMAVGAPSEPQPVPSSPGPEQRSVRLSNEELELLADAIQHLKFPHQPSGRPSVERFELLEALRQKLLDNL